MAANPGTVTPVAVRCMMGGQYTTPGRTPAMTDSTEPAGYGHAEALAPLAREAIAAMTPADYLTALGGTADEVAATLRQLGITGQQLAPSHCPVANYLREHAGMAHPNVSCSLRVVTARGVTYIPAPVAQFIRAFDLGYFPDLITPLPARDDDL